MKYVLATNQFIGFDTPIGGVVSRTFPLGRGNTVQISVIVKGIAHLGSPFLVIGLQFGNSRQNWTTDGVNIINALGIGYYTVTVPEVVGSLARVAYFTNSETAAIVAVSANVSIQ